MDILRPCFITVTVVRYDGNTIYIFKTQMDLEGNLFGASELTAQGVYIGCGIVSLLTASEVTRVPSGVSLLYHQELF